MLKEIQLTNFKCFRDETAFPLSKINLLTGINGRGKSSLLQALLLMKQSVEHNEYTNEIILNGNCVNLGRFEDIKNRNIDNNAIIFEFLFENSEARTELKYLFNKNLIIDKINIDFQNDKYHYIDEVEDKNKYGYSSKIVLGDVFSDENALITRHYQDDEGEILYSIYIGYMQELTIRRLYPYILLNTSTNDMYAKGVNQIYGLSLPTDMDYYNEMSWFFNFNSIHYISANRLGSQKFYHKKTLPSFVHSEKQGENIPSILSNLKENEIYKSLVLPDVENQLLKQTSAWLSKIFDTEIDIIIHDSYRSAIEMLFEIDGKEFLPTNVGFGYSYVLPIIVSGLIAKEGEILIIENPEAHLHEKAQHELMRFLAKVSDKVQIIIETHSEIIVNAMSVLVVEKELKTDDLHILHFENHKPDLIKIQPDGRRDKNPTHFFEQTDKDMNKILFN